VGRFKNRGQLSKQFSDLSSLVRAYKDGEKRRPQPPQAEIRHTPRPLDYDQASELVGSFRVGVEVKRLAAMYGVNRSTVATHLQRFDVRRPRTKLHRSDIDRVVGLYAEGWTIAAIAPELGVGATTVRRALLRAGATIRPRGRKP
jgi:Helix-turn-helix domain of resolvase